MKNISLLQRDIKRILKNNIKKLLWITLLTGFLFYLFNLFFSLSTKISDINDIITSKVGIYFYINDNNINQDKTYKRIINIKEQLGQQGIDAKFSSKEDAFNFLENKIPEITKNFDKFDIKNPFPSTLYVMFHNKDEYQIMKDIIIENKDIILNIKDIDKGTTLQQQEHRSLKIINIINIIKNSIYFILLISAIIIISFAQHLLKTFFLEFYKDLQTKKLLGATHKDANKGFILILHFIITIGFILGCLLSFTTLCLLNQNLVSIGIDIGLCNNILHLISLYIMFSVIIIALGYRRLKRSEKKLAK